MKVLHISGLRGWGGVFTFIKELAEYQRHGQGVDSAVLSLLTGAEAQEQALQAAVPVERAGLRSGWDVSLRRHARVLSIMRRYDILHFHGFSPSVAFCALLSGRTIVHTEHGTFQRANLRLSPSKYFRKRILGFTFLEHGADAVVFISHWLKDNLGLSRGDCTVIHNGTTAKGRCGTDARPTAAPFRVLGLGRFVTRKRFDRLIRGVAMVDDPSTMRLILLGDGALANDLKSLAEASLPAGSFTFRGYTADVSGYYESTDVVVLPTEFEPFGLVAVEAAMCAVPVICFRDGGGALEILDGIHERLIVDDEAGLAAALAYWREHEDERRAVGRALYERAMERFTIARMADDYRALYEGLTLRRFETPAAASPWAAGS